MSIRPAHPTLALVAWIAGACSSGGDATVAPPPPAPPAPPPSLKVALEPAFAQLPAFDQPVAMLQAPGDADTWYAVERAGRVLAFANADDATTTTAFVDLRAEVDSSAGEAGLLGLAFDPDFQTNGAVYLSFTRTGPISYVSRFFSFDGGVTLDPTSEQVLISVAQDFNNHNGGQLAFGPDGYLYIGFGDGGSANDPNNRAQDTTNLMGAMVRIDVSGNVGYAIPPDNPFAGNAQCAQGFGGADCPELYAWGLRNPWRWSFDRSTGDLWAGDVGQDRFEEIDRIVVGANYGWRIREGANCNRPMTGCDATGLTDPVVEYDHGQGSSVTGGYVYRGGRITAFDGVYVYGDFVSGTIWGLVDDGQGGVVPEVLVDSALRIASFAEALDGTLYVLDYSSGRPSRLVDDN